MSKLRRREPFRLPELDGVRETQATKAYHAIRAMILRCELSPGSVINDRDLTKRLRIGRTPIREALLRLSGERLVIFQQNQSIQVSAVDLAQINDLYTLRLHLERLAWRLWLERATQDQVERLTHVFDPAAAMQVQGDIEGIIDLDFLFHSQVYQECGNALLTKTLYSLSGLTYRLWYMTNGGDVKAQVQTAYSHAPIIDAVLRGDLEKLDSEISNHIASAYQKIMDSFTTRVVSRIGDMPIKRLTKREERDVKVGVARQA
jgi:DNA-binding GntR family transcriptional regulator